MTTTRMKQIAVAAILLVSIIGGMGGVAAEYETVEEEAPLYENSSDPDTDSWFDGVEATSMSGIVTMVSRVGTFVIGGGGSGISGQLLTGVAVAGIGIGSVARANVGGVAGVVLGITAVFVGVGTGIAPEWISAILMFAVGLVLASVFRRVIT